MLYGRQDCLSYFFDTYNLFVGQSVYIEDVLSHIWDIVLQSHALVDKVLELEKQLSAQYPAVAKYSFEQNGNLFQKQYSVAFSTRLCRQLKIS